MQSVHCTVHRYTRVSWICLLGLWECNAKKMNTVRLYNCNTVLHTVKTVQHTVKTVLHTLKTVQHTFKTVLHTFKTVLHTVKTLKRENVIL